MRPRGNDNHARLNKHVKDTGTKIAVKSLSEDVLEDIVKARSEERRVGKEC